MEEILNFFTDHTGVFVALVTGIPVLVILGYELRMRRKILTSQYELERLKFKADQKNKAGWQIWLERQKTSLANMTLPIAEIISKELKEDHSWATEAIQRAKLGPYSDTLFGDRSGHFRNEKELLAKEFCSLLLGRCKYLCEKKGHDVYILVDSGTTLFPLFKHIAIATVKAHNNNEEWLSKLNIITNNLPGMQSLMEYGRPTPSNRYSGLAVNSRLLPGVPLPIYSAVTGRETERYLKLLKRNVYNSGRKTDSKYSPVFISVMTGNWIRINEKSSHCPIPLARGDGHLHFKQQLIDYSDEVYVIAPLGKIFANAEINTINEALGLASASVDAEKQAYEEVSVNGGDKYKKVKLVSTSRKDGRLLSKLSTYLSGVLQTSERIDRDQFIKCEIGETKHLLYPFDALSGEPSVECEEEFPHYQTRTNEFTDFFIHPQNKK